MDELVQQLVSERGSKPRASSGGRALISPAGGDGEKTRLPSLQLRSNDDGSWRV